MTPKERARLALLRKQPDKVPTMEIEFQLHRQLTGHMLILGKEFSVLCGLDRERTIAHNVQIYCECAEKLDYSAITIDPLYWEFGHGVGTKFYYGTPEDQIDVARALYREIGGSVFLAVSIDSTYSIPQSEDMEQFVEDMYDAREDLVERAESRLIRTIEYAKRIIDAGVGVIYSCSDYCFGTGPFFSTEMFEVLIYPFLKRQTEAFREAGAYVIKHTDGNIDLIAEIMIDCNPHAIHSIDPMAGMDITRFQRKFGDRVCVMGNVDVSKLHTGPTEEIIASSERALSTGMAGGGYIFSTCNTVFEAIPLENYLAMLAVRERLGWYSKPE